MKMTKKTTKRALVSSLVMIALCFTMLVGTTFAWFTDSASSTGNVITTGTLDVKLTQKDANGNYTEVTGPVFDNVLWEPNATYVEYFRIENAGSLALKFGVALNVTAVTKNLNEVLEYAVVDGTSLTSWTSGTAVANGNNVTSIDGITLAPQATYDFALAVHMDHNAGNTYQDASITFDVNVMATQATYESDSFDNQYDAGADAPVVSTAADLAAALANGGEVALGADVTFSEIVTVAADTVIYGNGNTLSSTAGRAINVDGDATVTIKDLTIECTGERAINVINGAANVTLENVTATASNYAVMVATSAAGANVTVNNCDLTGLNVVNIAAPNATVNVNNCSLVCNDNSAVESYAAVCTYPTAENTTIVVTGCDIEVTGDSMKAFNSCTTATITIADSTEEILSAVAYIDYHNGYSYAFTNIAKAINKAVDGDVITLLADATIDTTTFNKTVTIDANGFNLTVDGTAQTGTVTVVGTGA